MDKWNLTAVEMGTLLHRGEVSCLEVTEQLLQRITENQAQNPTYLTVTAQQALERAEKLRDKLPEGILSGVPAGVKDNICTANIATTCASRMLKDFVSPYDATVMERFYAGGGILLGKHNMDEFAMGSTGETSFFGGVSNPWDTARTPGGSSAGSAASVALGECFYALASDTGGSIRQPAAYCGVTGMKPTYGTVSRYGLIAHASSLDQIGPLAQTAEDCAAVLDLIRGQDSRDGTTVPCEGPSLLSQLTGDLRGIRVGLCENLLGTVEESVRQGIVEMGQVLRIRGACVESIHLPLVEQAVSAYYILSSAQASSNLARYDGVKYGYRGKEAKNANELYAQSRSQGFGWEVKRRLMMGTFVLSAGHYEDWYRKALWFQSELRRRWGELFQRYDLLLLPVTYGAAPKLACYQEDPLRMYQGDAFTVGANLGGLPAISIPCRPTAEGLPLGVQLMGRPMGDAAVLKAAYAVQQETDYHLRKPWEVKR